MYLFIINFFTFSKTDFSAPRRGFGAINRSRPEIYFFKNSAILGDFFVKMALFIYY